MVFGESRNWGRTRSTDYNILSLRCVPAVNDTVEKAYV